MQRMFHFLKNHPFAVSAYFESSLVLTFAVPKDELASMIPPCLTLDTFKDEKAFIAIAMVQTQHLRPRGFPKFMCNHFFLVGYRIFVRYTTSSGRRLRGLYIIQSQTNQKKMEIMGNIFTHYNYQTIDIKTSINNGIYNIDSEQAGLSVRAVLNETDIPLPTHSPFADWKEARRFAGPLPFTFTFQPTTNEVLIIEGVRNNWTPEPVKILNYKSNFLESLSLHNCQLANAFIIKNIPYYWKKGRIDQWNP